MPPRRLLSAVLAAACLLSLVATLTACGPSSDAPTELGEQPAPSSEETPPAPAPDPLHVSAVKPKGTERAVIDTDKGLIEIDFYLDKAPNTVASFIELARAGFYDGQAFHRTAPGQFIQAGDPYSRTGDPRVGTGGPGWRLKAEFNDVPHVEGSVSMARTDEGPDTAGSQFFIVLEPLPGLDGKYTVFGHVVRGLDVAKAVTVGTVIRSITIRESPGS